MLIFLTCPFIWEHCGGQNPKMLPNIPLMCMHWVISSPWLQMGLNWLGACSSDKIIWSKWWESQIRGNTILYITLVGLEEASFCVIEMAKSMRRASVFYRLRTAPSWHSARRQGPFKNIYFYFIYLAVPSLSCSMWDLVPWPGIKSGSLELGAQTLSYWVTREVLKAEALIPHQGTDIFQQVNWDEESESQGRLQPGWNGLQPDCTLIPWEPI